jgi:hypothetical protein
MKMRRRVSQKKYKARVKRQKGARTKAPATKTKKKAAAKE